MMSMMSSKRPASIFKPSVIHWTAVIALAVTVGVPRSQAQSARALEVQHQRLLPLFELAGVVFTDADETNGRLVVGVLDRDVEGLVRARLRVLGISSQSVNVVATEPILRVATLRDRVRPVVGGLEIRFSQFLCSLGFVAWRDGVEGYVTASHCSDRQGDVDGTLYYQPLNQVPDEFIGTEIADPEFFRNSDGCPRGRKCHGLELQRCRRRRALYARHDRQDDRPNGSLEIAGESRFRAKGRHRWTDRSKVGRSTGWTQASSHVRVNTGVSASNIVLRQIRRAHEVVAGGDTVSVFRTNSTRTSRHLGNFGAATRRARCSSIARLPISSANLEP